MTDLIGPLLTRDPEKQTEKRRRSKNYIEQNVDAKLVEDLKTDGWEFSRKLKTSIKVRKRKPHDELLENDFWLTCFNLGFQELNEGRQFKILLDKRGGQTKQVDVFAKDDETVIVAECKSNSTLSRRQLRKDLEEFSNIRKPIADTIKKHYGRDYKPKILWLFVTHNIIWSSEDQRLAESLKIAVITDRELRYLKQLVSHLGFSAKYQFMAEYFGGQAIPGLADVQVPAARGKLGGNTFYSFVSTPRQLLKIAFVNHRALDDPDGAPTYQRLLTKSRLKNIGSFLDKGGFFPTNILLNFAFSCTFDRADKDKKSGVQFGRLHLPNTYKSAWVIDGQHRLYGYSRADKKHLDDNIFVIAFDRLKKDEEANLFIEINSKQTNVPRGLLDELEGELKWGSDNPSERLSAVISRLINELNGDRGGPFFGRVAAHGVNVNDVTCLTTPGIKVPLKRSGLLGHYDKSTKSMVLGPLSGENSQKTLERAREVFSYIFDHIRTVAPHHWDAGKLGYLCTNVGVGGWFILISKLMDWIQLKENINFVRLRPDKVAIEVLPYLEPILRYLKAAHKDEMKRYFSVPFGSGGPNRYYFKLVQLVNSEFSTFLPAGFEDWQNSQSEENIRVIEESIKWIQAVVLKYVFGKLRTEYGEDYFDEAVPNKDWRRDAFVKSQDYPKKDRLPLENYLNLFHLQKIAKEPRHWPMFEALLNIPPKGLKKQGKNVSWMEEVNKLRRVPAHSSFDRMYKIEDFEFISYVSAELKSKLAYRTLEGDALAAECLQASFSVVLE